MSINSFGHLFRVTTWGESHGPALGATVDGCPPGVEITPEMIQHWLDKRKPGQNKYTTQRREADEVRILSGTFEGVTTGTPIQLMIENTDQRSKDYGDIKEKFRPGHADITYFRNTACATIAVAGVPRHVKPHHVWLRAAWRVKRSNRLRLKYRSQATWFKWAPIKINRDAFDWDQIEQNPFWVPDAKAATDWAAYLDGLRKSGSSVGAIIEVTARNVPAGIGAPVYGKLDTDLAAAMMSINAVKGVEIGEGMSAAMLTGELNADEIFMGNDGQPAYSSNHSGGILGGISTGQDIVVRFAVKPTSSILTTRKTITKSGEETEIITKGRHDPCVGIRAVPVGEAMMACVILDHLLLHRGQIGQNRGIIG